VDAPRTWQNVETFIGEWKRRRSIAGAAHPALPPGVIDNQ